MDFPFELRDGRIWVEVSLRGATKSGILDTGADGTAIDQGLSEELGLKRGKIQSATSVASDLEVTKTDPIEFGLGKSSLTAEEANILPLSTHIKGLSFILGFDALRKLPFTIDYSKSLLQFGSMPKGVSAQFTLSKDIRPTVELNLAGARIPAMLDTGSAAGIVLPVSWVKKNLTQLALEGPQRRAILGSEYESQRFVLAEVMLGGTHLTKVEAQAVEAEKGSFGDQEDNLATIGNPILGMFEQVGIDGARRMITLVR